MLSPRAPPPFIASIPSFICISIGIWIFILFFGVSPSTLVIYSAAQLVPLWAVGVSLSFRLVPVSFRHVSASFSFLSTSSISFGSTFMQTALYSENVLYLEIPAQKEAGRSPGHRQPRPAAACLTLGVRAGAEVSSRSSVQGLLQNSFSGPCGGVPEWRTRNTKTWQTDLDSAVTDLRQHFSATFISRHTPTNY